jgi:hypothetical protein
MILDNHLYLYIFFGMFNFFFDNFGCSGQRYVDTCISTNLNGTRNKVLSWLSDSERIQTSDH